MTPEELRETLRAAMDEPAGVLAQILATLTYLRQESADGRPFTSIATGVTDGATGNAVVAIQGPSVGQVWHLERVGVSVGGASAAASCALYLDSPANDVDLLDYANAMLGNNPSRVVFGAPGAPYLIPNGTPVLIVVASAVVNSPVSVRYQGRVVEVANGGGRV